MRIKNGLTFAVAFAFLLAGCASPKTKPAAAGGQRIPTVAVMDFAAVDVSTAEAAAAAGAVREAVAGLSGAGYALIDRRTIGNILRDLDFDIVMGKDEELAVRVGRVIGARMMVMGTVSKWKGDYVLDVEAMDVEAARVIAAETRRAPAYGGLMKESRAAGDALAKKLSAYKVR
jgi:hypothetical protein